MPDTNNVRYAGRPERLGCRRVGDVPTAAGAGEHFDAPVITTIIRVATTLTWTDDGATLRATTKLMDLPEGIVLILGACGTLTYAAASGNDANIFSALGTTTPNADGDLTDSGEGNVVASTSTGISSLAGTFTAKATTTPVLLDNTGNTLDLNLNLTSTTTADATGTITVTGTLAVTYVNLGDTVDPS